MDNIKITVLMSVYNGEVYVGSAIESILGQTYSDFEFLIINDASTDKTREIITSYIDERIRLIDNDGNMGLTRSLNKGIQLANGEYIARQDADDISMPNRLGKMLAFMEENKDVGIVGSSFQRFDENNEVIEHKILETEDEKIKEKLLEENHFGFEMFRKTVLLKAGGYRTEFKYAQDYDLCLRMAEISKVANIKEVLYVYRVTIDSISIAKYYAQQHFASFAKQLAKERKQFGQDFLQTKSREEIRGLLEQIDKESNRIFSKYLGFYKWGRYYYFKGDIERAFGFLTKYFPLTMFYKTTPLLVLRIFIKLLIRKVFINQSKKDAELDAKS